MVERGWGRIVNMSSVAGTLGGFGQASYSTTKAGLLGLTKTLALEGARHGITCERDRARDHRHRGLPLRQPGDERADGQAAPRSAPAASREEMANAVAFLCSDLASYITGVGLNVTGGIELFTF